jgi:hypothetical protein
MTPLEPDPAVAIWADAYTPATHYPLPPWSRPHMWGFECRGRWLAEPAAAAA